MIEAKGFGRKILFSEMTKESLKSMLNEMISNKKYTDNAKLVSKIFNGNLEKPLDEGIHWIEYVAKFNGAKHLKSPAVNLPWYKYLYLDVLSLLLLVIYTSLKIINSIFKKLFGSIKKDKTKFD